jgi:CBS domain-containing protein
MDGIMSVCPLCDFENIEGTDVCEECGQPLDDLHLPDPATAVERSLLKDRVRVLNPKTPIVVPPDMPVPDVLRILVDRRIGCVFVASGESLLGVFSERDAVLRLSRDPDDYAHRPISDFMTPNPQALRSDAKVAFAVRMMDLGGYRHVPLVDENQRATGVISVRDILRYLTEKMTESNSA